MTQLDHYRCAVDDGANGGTIITWRKGFVLLACSAVGACDALVYLRQRDMIVDLSFLWRQPMREHTIAEILGWVHLLPR